MNRSDDYYSKIQAPVPSRPKLLRKVLRLQVGELARRKLVVRDSYIVAKDRLLLRRSLTLLHY